MDKTDWKIRLIVKDLDMAECELIFLFGAMGVWRVALEKGGMFRNVNSFFFQAKDGKRKRGKDCNRKQMEYKTRGSIRN